MMLVLSFAFFGAIGVKLYGNSQQIFCQLYKGDNLSRMEFASLEEDSFL